MEYEKLIPKLRKLREMALRGEKHEAENAAAMLGKFLLAHNLVMSDLDEDEPTKDYFFSYGYNENKKFVFCTCAHNLGLDTYGVRKGGKKIREVAVTTTPAIWAELNNMTEFYLSEYQRELSTFNRAFVGANNLWSTIKRENEDSEEMSEEEMLQAKRAHAMQIGITTRSYRRQLKS